MNNKIDQDNDITTTETDAGEAVPAPRKPLTLTRQAVKVLKVQSGVQTGACCKEGVSHRMD